MIPRGRRRHAALLASFGALGLLAGHGLDYVLAVPSSRRDVLLASSGHAWLRAATVVAPALLAVVVVGTLALGASGRRFGGGSRRRAPGLVRARLWPALAAAQSAAFLALEVGERVLSGVPLATLTPRLLAAGVAAQVATALVAAVAIVALERAGGALASLAAGPHRRVRRAPSRPRADEPGILCRSPLRWVAPSRAPPAAAVL